MFDRAGLAKLVGEAHIFWDAAQAIVAIHRKHEIHGCGKCGAEGERCPVFRAAQQAAAIELPDSSPALV